MKYRCEPIIYDDVMDCFYHFFSKAILFHSSASKWSYFGVYNKPITRLNMEKAVVWERVHALKELTTLCVILKMKQIIMWQFHKTQRIAGKNIEFSLLERFLEVSEIQAETRRK